jgi:hypothetical protein
VSPISKYLLIGLAILVVISIFSYFSDEENVEYDYYGIVHDIKSTSNGYIFYLDTLENDIRCYSSGIPNDLDMYAVKGSFSSDGNLFFVEFMMDIDKNELED